MCYSCITNLFVNFLKNFLMNFSNRLVSNSRLYISTIVYGIAAVLRVNADAEAISEGGGRYTLLVNDPMECDHDTAINPLVMFLFVGILIYYLLKKKALGIKKNSIVSLYVTLTTVSALVFFAILRWDSSATRYEDKQFVPDCIIITKDIPDGDAFEFRGDTYSLVFTEGDRTTLWERQ